MRGYLFSKGSVLDITDIQYDARGRYFCEALNEVGDDRREVKLTVLRKYRLHSSTTDVSIRHCL